ncbi:MAG: hypothetical protein FGM58_10040 [Acidimicrobiia bacterium]|nr:hypothetical protein [Acidimicrobiia bacterium]
MEPTTTTSTLIGPNGTVPGLGFIEQQVRPRQDASGERAAGVPLLLGGVVMMAVVVTVFHRAWRVRRRAERSADRTV